MARKDTDLQNDVGQIFSDASKLFGLTVDLDKTEVLYQPAPNTNPSEPEITIDGTKN